MVKSSLDARASDLDASFDIRPVVTEMSTAGASSLLEPAVFMDRFCIFHCLSCTAR